MRLDRDLVAYLATALASSSGDAPEATIKLTYVGENSFDLSVGSSNEDLAPVGTVHQISASVAP